MPPVTTPPLLEQPVQRLLSFFEINDQRRLIALAGLPGAGKSTLAMRLAAEVNAQIGADRMIALGMDGFHLTKAELRRFPDPDAALARRGAPWTFDRDALARRLQNLRDGAGRDIVPWPDFEHGVGDPVEAAYSVTPDVRLVLVEGLYLLCRHDGWDAVSDVFDEHWYLDTPFNLAMERLIRRHRAAWGLTQDAAEARVAANDRLNAEIVLSSRSFADWLVSP